MKFLIEWITFLNVKNETKANKLIDRIEKTIGLKAINRNIEVYWKDTTKMKVDFLTICVDDMSIEEAVFRTISIVNYIGVLWSVYSPSIISSKNSNEIVWSFEGICNNPRIPGVTWIQFILSTDGEREYGWEV